MSGTDIPQTPFVHPEDRGALSRRRWRLHEILEVGSASDRASTIFDTVIVILILSNVIVFAASTVSELDAKFHFWFEAFNVFSVAVFTVEYLARLWVCIDLPPLRHMPPWKARLKFAATPLLIIDLLAILPFYLGNLVGVDLRSSGFCDFSDFSRSRVIRRLCRFCFASCGLSFGRCSAHSSSCSV